MPLRYNRFSELEIQQMLEDSGSDNDIDTDSDDEFNIEGTQADSSSDSNGSEIKDDPVESPGDNNSQTTLHSMAAAIEATMAQDQTETTSSQPTSSQATSSQARVPFRGKGQTCGRRRGGVCAQNPTPSTNDTGNQEISRDGTIWEALTPGIQTPGKLAQQDIMNDIPGPTAHAKRNIIDGSVTSAFS